ncbi:MAG: hypothetical protein JWQ71_3373 [Pedosphaera sp.]|nr:hypothetical protein [Pedosphaera sp.]
MKPIYIIPMLAVFFALFIAYGADSRLGVKTKREPEHMFIANTYIAGDGPNEWFSALQLGRIARRYVEEKKVDFRFEGAEMSVWVKTKGGKVLADFSWSSGMGKPSLQVEIGRDGKPISYSIGKIGE